MNRFIKTGSSYICAFLIICCLLLPEAAVASDTRRAVWAGKFYPASSEELKTTLSQLEQQTKGQAQGIARDKDLRALILPHAGYPYSGPTAAHACPILKKREFSRVIVMGPDHRVGLNNASISDVQYYSTPLGKVKLDPLAAKLLQEHSLYKHVEASDKKEHSVEVILPFLQHTLQDFSIVPIVTGSGNPDDYVQTLAPQVNNSTLLVASSDLSHYLPYSRAKERDKETLDMIESLKSDKIASSQNRACGKLPISIILKMAQNKGWEPVVLDYSNSGDTAGTRDKVVGYTAVAFFQNSSREQTENRESTSFVTSKQGQALLALARRSIRDELAPEKNSSLPQNLQKALQSQNLQNNRGTFVTLNKNHRLRGCMGNIKPNGSIVESIEKNALKAAFQDPRFPPLSKGELEQTRIKISILTRTKPLDFNSPQQLLNRLEKEKPGVIVRKGFSRSTYLPQVWEKLQDPPDFFEQALPKGRTIKTCLEKPRYPDTYLPGSIFPGITTRA